MTDGPGIEPSAASGLTPTNPNVDGKARIRKLQARTLDRQYFMRKNGGEED
jgi:hypothetical protein